MGLFDIFKRNKVNPAEVLKNYSLQDLAEVIGNGVGDDNAKKRQPELSSNINIYVACFEEYFKRLVFGDVSDGGFGGNESLFFDKKARGFFAWSVNGEGIHGITNYQGQLVVYNYKLEFLRNYIRSGNTTPLRIEWLNLIFEIFDDETQAFGEKAIANYRHDIYNPWIYEGDADFVYYKIQTVTFLSDPAKMAQWGLYKPDENGKPTNEFITIKDLTHIDNQRELMAYIDSLQTNNS